MVFRRPNFTPEAKWPLWLSLLPILVKLHLILGFFQASPMYFFSGLGLGPRLAPTPPYPSLDFNVGATSQALGHRAALDLLSFHMPWWNPFEGAGTPLAGEMQAAALLPFNLLLALPEGQLYMQLLFQIIAGVFTFLLMRRLKASCFAAFIAGVLFEFNGTFGWLANAVINPIAFLPVILFGIEGVRAALPGAWRWIALGLALSLYAGFPEMAYIDGLLAGVWTLARIPGLPLSDIPARGTRIGLGVVTGLLLAAPILIAFLDYLPHATLVMHQNGFFSKSHIARIYAIALLLPYIFGILAAPTNLHVFAEFWGRTGGYAGIGLTTLAVLGLCGRTHRPLRLALAAWVALCWAAAYGIPPGQLLWLLPDLSNTAFYRYFDPASAMSLAVLAGLALDDFAQPTRSKWWYWAALGVTALMLASAFAVASEGYLDTHFIWFRNSMLIAGLMSLGLLWAGASNLPLPKRQLALGLLVAAEATINFAIPTFANPRHISAALGGIEYLQTHLGIQRIYSMGAIEPNYGSYFGIAEIDDCDLPIPAKWLAFRNQHLDKNADILMFDGVARSGAGLPPASDELNKNLAQYQAVGVKYIVTTPGNNPFTPANQAPKVYSDKVMDIYQLPNPRPYFTAPACEVTPHSRTEAEVNCNTPTVLTRLELIMPGWRAWVNGQAVPVVETSEIFQQVALPAGRSLVQFQFRPPFMRFGYAAFALGILLLVGGRKTKGAH